MVGTTTKLLLLFIIKQNFLLFSDIFAANSLKQAQASARFHPCPLFFRIPNRHLSVAMHTTNTAQHEMNFQCNLF